MVIRQGDAEAVLGLYSARGGAEAERSCAQLKRRQRNVCMYV